MSANNKERENAVREFDAFIKASIRLLCFQAVRSVIGNRKRLVFVPIEDLSSSEKEKYLSILAGAAFEAIPILLIKLGEEGMLGLMDLLGRV